MDGKKKKEKYDDEIKYKHICTYCDYRTNKAYNYNKHIETPRHNNAIEDANMTKTIFDIYMEIKNK